jgi:hypothetical protein
LAAAAVFTATATGFGVWASGEGGPQVGLIAEKIALPPLDARTTPDLGQLSTTLSRPLFREDRRAPPSVQAPADAAPDAALEPPPASRLIAVAIGPDRRAAILQLTAGGTAVLMQGEQTGGWTLDDIAPDHVTLREGARAARLALQVSGRK